MPFRGRIDTKALGIVWRGARDVTKENYSHYSVQSVPVTSTADIQLLLFRNRMSDETRVRSSLE